MKKDYEYIEENHDEEQQHEHHEAHRARGLRQPQQPTPQQIAEHNLTHLPYRNWCPICVQGKGRQDNYKKQQSRQPVIQVDFAYIKSQQDSKTIPVLTAVDVTTQLCMAVMVPDKPSMMDYMANSLQAFIFECGRTQGILQSDNEDRLNALLKATAAKVGSMTVRHAPSYSSNSQGSVERLYRTLLGQVRVVKAQVESNYSMTMFTKQCLLPWIVRHAAWTVNRYNVIHSGGYTSFERRWGRNYERAICEFGPSTTTQETSKSRPTDAEMHLARKSFRNRTKLRRNGIRRTKSTSSTEATTGLQIRPRAVEQSFRHTMGTTTEHLQPIVRNTVGYATTTVRERKAHARFRTTDERTDDIVVEPATKQQRATPPPRLPSTSTSSSRPLPDSPMATSPTGRQHPPLPAPPRQTLRRLTPDEVMQPTKAQKTSKDTTIRSTEQATKEPQPLRQKIKAVTLPNGTSITPYTNDDTSEDQPIFFDNTGRNETRVKPNETTRRLRRRASAVGDSLLKEAIPTRWANRKKGPGVRSRIVAKGYAEKIEDEDSVYASTLMFTTLRTLLALQMSRPNCIARLGDVASAFLHAPIAKDHDGKQRNVYLWPPKELCPQQDKIWRLKKAMCGLRSSPTAWQDYLAEVLHKLSFVRLKSEPNVYTNETRNCYIMVYVDDLLVLGDKTAVDSTFEAVQKQVLLKHIGYLEPGKPQ